jgi:NAD-dependent DNA ligase
MQPKRSRCPNGTRKNNKGECKPFSKLTKKKVSDKLSKNKESIEKLEIDKKLKPSPNINKSTLKIKKSNKKMSKSLKKGKKKLKIVSDLKIKNNNIQMKKKIYNDDFINILTELQDIESRVGEPFKARAYQKAAETIMLFKDDITDPKQLIGQPGIGKTIMNKLNEYVQTGKLNAIEKHKKDPITLLTKVYGIGPKKAEKLINDGVDSIEKLKQNPDKLNKAQNIGVEYFDEIESKIPREEIDQYNNILQEIFNDVAPPNSKFEIVGSYRRGKNQSGDIDILITNDDDNKDAYDSFLKALKENKIITHFLTGENLKGVKSLTIGKLPNKPHRRLDFMYTPPNEYPFATLYFTGSKAFNVNQRQRAVDLGYTLNEHGLYNFKNKKKTNRIEGDFPNEESIFDFLGMEYKTPQQRKDGRAVIFKNQQLSPVSPVKEELAPEDKVDTLPEKKSNTLLKKVKNKTIKLKLKTNTISNIEKFKSEGTNFLKTLTENELNQMLIESNKAYYNNNEPLMSDDQYDILREYTLEKHPNNLIAKNAHAEMNMEEVTKNKVQLPYEMWSMDKIKPDTEALEKWTKKYEGPYVLSCKLDGVSGLYVSPDKLFTRGNGRIGQDISYLIPYLQLPKQNNLAIRGEFIIPKNLFESKYADKFSNARNFVSGIVNKKTVNPEQINDIDFVAYELIEPSEKPSKQLEILTNLDIEVVRFLKEEEISNELLSELLQTWRNDYKYEIDGVICVNDEIYKRSSKNPDHAFAFKMVLGDQIAETKVLNVIWTASKDGYLKPRVQIEPVKLGGATIEYATGFNAKFIVDNKIGVGAVISIIRSGDVIPHILSVTRPAPEPQMPNRDYSWNETNVDIILNNKTDDEIVNQKIITAFFKTIDVEGLGPGNVKKIIKAGYTTIPDILKMSEEDFMKVEGFKDKTSKKLFTGIKEKINKASLPTLMDATNIWGRGFGKKRFASILKDNPDIIISDVPVSEKEKLVEEVPGMAKKSAIKFVENLNKFKEWAESSNLSDKLIYNENEKADISHPLYDKNIILTGFRDKELQNKLEEIGAKLGNSVSKNTFIVLVKDLDETTGKVDEAKKLNIPIMTIDQFKKKYNLD